jgi:uncharacterized protein YecE (DUF72 family)
MRAADLLGAKKGCLLIQYPASISSEYIQDVAEILHRIHQLNIDSQWNLALEFRHVSWYEDQTREMLNKYKASMVFHDKPNSKTPLSDFDAKIVYLRFHGPEGNYRGSYSDDFLNDYAERIRDWQEEGKEVYIYFNNTMGSALQNALLMKELIG